MIKKLEAVETELTHVKNCLLKLTQVIKQMHGDNNKQFDKIFKTMDDKFSQKMLPGRRTSEYRRKSWPNDADSSVVSRQEMEAIYESVEEELAAHTMPAGLEL